MSTPTGSIVLVGRIMFAYFFGVVAGIGHFKRDEMMRGAATSASFPVPGIAGWPVGVWLICGALSIALGVWPDFGALMIAMFLVPATLYFHRFWDVEDPAQRRSQQSMFYRNIIGFGAAIMMFGAFVALGPALRFTITKPLFDF